MEKDLLIESELKKEINKLILEELTVSHEVLEASKKVENYILNNIKSSAVNTFANGGGERKINFHLQLFEEKIKINFDVTNYNFINKKYYENFKKKYDTNVSCASSYRKVGNKIFAICWINYLSVGFIPFSKFYEDLHHELNHILQQSKADKEYQGSKKYVLISTDIFSDDEVKKDSANILYLCNPYEQDSFVSSVYSYVRHKYQTNVETDTIDSYIKGTDAYKNLYKIKFLYEKIKTNKEKYANSILNIHGFKQWEIFDHHVVKSIKRFEKKLATVIKKCKKDFLVFEEYTWCEGPDFKRYYLLN